MSLVQAGLTDPELEVKERDKLEPGVLYVSMEYSTWCTVVAVGADLRW